MAFLSHTLNARSYLTINRIMMQKKEDILTRKFPYRCETSEPKLAFIRGPLNAITYPTPPIPPTYNSRPSLTIQTHLWLMCDNCSISLLLLSAVAIYCAVIVLRACINFLKHHCNYGSFFFTFINLKTILIKLHVLVGVWLNWTHHLCLHAKLNDWIACALNTCCFTSFEGTPPPTTHRKSTKATQSHSLTIRICRASIIVENICIPMHGNGTRVGRGIFAYVPFEGYSDEVL